MRGGNGGAAGQPGQSVSSGVVRLLAAGGGGAGSGSVGGRSGFAAPAAGRPLWWQWLQSGAGGDAGQPGGFPSGGGGAPNGAGGGGCVSVIEYLEV